MRQWPDWGKLYWERVLVSAPKLKWLNIILPHMDTWEETYNCKHLLEWSAASLKHCLCSLRIDAKNNLFILSSISILTLNASSLPKSSKLLHPSAPLFEKCPGVRLPCPLCSHVAKVNTSRQESQPVYPRLMHQALNVRVSQTKIHFTRSRRRVAMNFTHG